MYRADLGDLAIIAIYNFLNVADIFSNGDDCTGMGVGTANGGRWAAKHRRRNAAILHNAPLVVGSHGGAVVGELDSICARQLALHNIGALSVVVCIVRLFVFAGL